MKPALILPALNYKNFKYSRFVWAFIAILTNASFCMAQSVCGFEYKKEIVIQASQVAGTGSHSDFPILISEVDNDLRHTGSGGNVTNVNGYDIRFYDDNCVELEHQIERYVSTTGEFVAWVKIPSLSTSSNTTIHMLYGNTSLTTDPSTTNVWDANFVGVWHLNNNDFTDGTSTGNNGTNSGSNNNATAKIAGGRTFNGTTDYVQVPTTSWSTAAGTIELWGYASSFSANHHYYFGHTTVPAWNNRIQLYTNDAAGNLDLGLGNSHSRHTNIQNLNTAQWYHIVLTWDGTNYEVFVDGSSAASGTYAGFTTLQTFADIGNDGNASVRNEALNGHIDEVRVSNSVRSDGWIATCFNNQNNPATFYTISAEEDIYVTSNADGDWDQAGTWDSGTIPDDAFATVIINHDVDIDAGSGDYTVCTCEINGNGSQDTRLDISSNRVFTVKEDLDANFTGAGANGSRLRVSNTAQADVGGDMNWTRSNSDGGVDLEVLLRDDAVINLTGNFTGNITNGDDLTIDLEDDSDFNISGDITLDQDGGDELRVRIDDNARIDLSGDLNIDQAGGDDVYLLLNSASGTAAQFNIGDDVIINHTTGDDIEFETNAANSSIAVTDDITATLSGDNDGQILDFNLNGGDFTADAVSITRSADNGFVHFDLDGGDFTANSITFSSSGTLFNDGYINIEVDEASVFTVNGNIDATMTGADDFRIEVNNNGGSTAQFDCTGNFTINRTGGDDIEFFVDDDNSLFHVGGNLTITSSGGERVAFNLDNDATLDVDGNLSITHSGGQDCEIDLEYDAGNADPLFNVDGNFTLTNSAGDDEWLIDINGGTMQIDGNMQLTNSGAGGTEDILVEIDEDAILNVGSNLTIRLSGGDDLKIDLGDNSTASTAQINVTGSFTLDHNGNTGGDDMHLNFHDNTRGTIGSDLTIDSDFTGDDILIVRINTTSELDVDGNISFVAATDGKSELEINNDGVLYIAGDFQRAISPNNFGILDCNNNATVVYDGAAAQQFAEDDGAGTDEFDYQNVTINNTFGTPPQLTMEGLATVHSAITFTDGVVSTNSTDLLIVDDNATSTGASDASHVDGPVRKIGNDAFTFPVGDDDNYQPIAISAPSNTTDHFTAQYIEVDPHPTYDHNLKDVSIHHVSSCEYWTLDRTGGTSNVTVTLAWDANSCGVTNLSELLVARWDGSQWRDHGNGGTTGNTTAGTVVTSAVVTAFSPFTLASTTSANPLPIELLSFSGYKKEEVNVLEWTTATEINNDYFTLERSESGVDFYPIGQIAGAGNSSQILNYSYFDKTPNTGTNYYRLKQTDYNGDYSYSETILLNNEGTEKPGIFIYPNPTWGQPFNIQVSGLNKANKVTIVVSNSLGQVVEEIQTSTSNSVLMEQINTQNMAPGLYNVSIVTSTGSSSARVVVK